MKKVKRILAVCLAICLVLSLGACRTGDSGETSGETGAPDPGTTTPDTMPSAVTYTVTLTSELGAAFEGVGIYVYEDASKQELVWFARTDATGTISFTAEPGEGYVAFLDNAPEGYTVQEHYVLTGEVTAIVLPVEMASEIAGRTFSLGDIMWDLSVTDVQGNTYTVSQLLEEKEAVLLNFWYMDCAPCRMEFPDLQKAWETRSDKLAVLALNPIDQDPAAIAQFAQEMGLTFPVGTCAAEVQSALRLGAYPTTVIIDRNGVISLIHEGGITGADVFGDIMDYFTAEDYQAGVVEDYTSILTPEDNVEEVINNPTEIGGVSSAELTVRAGETVYVDLYRMFDMYLQIKSENARLSYGGKTYQPSNGTIGVVVRTRDTFTPVTIGLTNTGTETETYKLTFSALSGSLNNPYRLNLGEFDVSIASGKEEGVYYSYTAEADGWLTLRCVSASQGVPYGFTLYNLNTYANRTLDTDAALDENGNTVVRIQVYKGNRVQFNPSALPDDSGSYPAIQMRFQATFTEGLEEVDPDAGKLIYAVTVTDSTRQPLAGVSVQIGTENLTTNEKGVAAVKLAAGTYRATVRLPAGYAASTTSLTLTETYPTQTLKFTAVEIAETKTYTVTVTDDTGTAMENVLVSVGESFTYTDASGAAAFSLTEGSYSAVVQIPEGYTCDTISFPFPEEGTELTVVLTKAQTGQPGPDDAETLTYTVTVVDYYGAPLAGTMVTFYRDGAAVGMKQTDAAGVASMDLAAGAYTAVLSFGTGAYTYDEASAVLSSEQPDATVIAIARRGDASLELYVGTAYYLNSGATYVDGLQADVISYFVFEPEEAGVFCFTTQDPNAVISYWGGNIHYITDQTGMTDYANNAFTLEIREMYVNNATYILGITGASQAVIEITRLGDVLLSDEEKAEWIIYEAQEPAETFDLTVPAGKKLTWLDLTAESISYVKGSDGYYHLNTADGPILYMNLGTDGRYLSLYGMLGFEQAGGTGLKATIYDEDGKFVKKEDYTLCMQSYIIACTDASGYGVYPLNDDLIYMMQSAGTSIGWYNSESPSYLFENVANINEELAWMFLICYVA